MIPQRVKLRGFLCYKDEQEVAFDGASLWMLAGMNGSGKSSIFDAVTFALFGHHRGGKVDAHELINKDCDRLGVEFEFTLDGKPYLIKRTLQRNARGGASGAQEVKERTADGKGGWTPIEGTNRKIEFDAWIRDNIGLNFETFTSSILLLQGKAEKLLDSTSKGRFEVLASIVDLERYEKLHRKADDLRKKQDNQRDTLESRLAALPEVTTEMLAEAEDGIANVEAARQQAELEVERLRDLEVRARQWIELQARRDAAQQRWVLAETLLGDAAEIERAAARLDELRQLLPRLQTIVEQRGQIHNAEAHTLELTKQKQKLETLRAEKDHALEQTRQQRSLVEAQIAGDETQHREAASQLRVATGQLAKLKEFEQHLGEQGRLLAELAKLPADPEGAARQAQEDCDLLAATALAATALPRMYAKRDELRQARDRSQQADQSFQEIDQHGRELADRGKALKPLSEEAAAAARQATEEATRLRTLLEQAQQQFGEITGLEGSTRCRLCGQELTEGHLLEERDRRGKDVRRFEAEWRRAADQQQAAQKKELELRKDFTGVEKDVQKAREDYLERRQRAEQAKADIDRLSRECGQVYAELGDPFRMQVSPAPPADWLSTTFPTDADLTALRQEAARLPEARRRQQEAVALVQRWHGLKARESVASDALTRLRADLPKNPQAVRQEHLRLESVEGSLDQGLKAARAQTAELQKQLDRLSSDRQQVQHQLAEASGRLHTEEATRQVCQQALNRALRELPSTWQKDAEQAGTKELYAWRGEQKSLEEAGAEQRGRELAHARASMEPLRQERAELELQQARFPEEARQDPVLVQGALQQAKQLLRQRDDDRIQSLQRKVQLEEYRRQRHQLDDELMQAEKDLALYKALATLLGRDRLQLYLVRQAERQVIDHANAVLDRLSGGQLFLRLCGEAGGEGNSEKALDLEAYNRVTGEKPINVTFLSGSQKFRVAVSLALGIGKYASKQHRPIESVIIDEGFGCLDKEGKQAMIQELHNLRGHLRCILLVSHQEEFADAFADGYRFELAEGATKVTRFQR